MLLRFDMCYSTSVGDLGSWDNRPLHAGHDWQVSTLVCLSRMQVLDKRKAALHHKAVGDPSETLLQWFCRLVCSVEVNGKDILQMQARDALSRSLPAIRPYLPAPAAGSCSSPEIFRRYLQQSYQSRDFCFASWRYYQASLVLRQQEGTVGGARLICYQLDRRIEAPSLTFAAQKYNPRRSCIHLKHSRSDFELQSLNRR